MTSARHGLGAACVSPIAACAPTETRPVDAPRQSATASATTVDAAFGSPDYPPKLKQMLDMSAFAEVPGQPCRARGIERSSWAQEQTVRERLREVRSDSLWLGRWARENLSRRLAYAGVGYDFEPRPGEALPDAPPPLLYEIVVTCSDPIRPPPLGDLAKDVPIVVRYNAPVSHEEFMARISGERFQCPPPLLPVPMEFFEGGMPTLDIMPAPTE
jgi:hypothetical protein